MGKCSKSSRVRLSQVCCSCNRERGIPAFFSMVNPFGGRLFISLQYGMFQTSSHGPARRRCESLANYTRLEREMLV